MTLPLRLTNLSSWFSSNPTIRKTIAKETASNLTLETVSRASSSVTCNSASKSKKNVQDMLGNSGGSSSRRCSCCPRRRFLGSILGTGLLPVLPSQASDEDSTPQDPVSTLKSVRPPRPEWYDELYALAMDKLMKAYEAEISGCKSQLFVSLRGKANKILEIGIGTGPNLKYYADFPGVNVFGVDPNRKMEKYVLAAAETSGLPTSNFRFAQAVAEDLPFDDASFDAVVGTLILCSVEDVDQALKEVRRVLKPGGLYIFVEHVAAKDGTILRFVQGILDPLQQTVADGCHLTRNTGTNIARAGFTSLDINQAVLSSASFVNPQVYGIAYR